MFQTITAEVGTLVKIRGDRHNPPVHKGKLKMSNPKFQIQIVKFKMSNLKNNCQNVIQNVKSKGVFSFALDHPAGL